MTQTLYAYMNKIKIKKKKRTFHGFPKLTVELRQSEV
jgi:hypothetical protein